jgi:RNA polymerase sigma-70 factor, ECF subfamily
VTDSDFRDAFHLNKDVLFRFAYRMTGSKPAAEDIVQDCFMALWQKPETYDSSRGTTRAYLLGIARNLVLKRWRREWRFADEESETASCEPVDLIGMERSAAVAAAVQALPPLQREALVLAEYEEMPLDEIARVSGADIGAVKSRLHRARQNLRRMLDPLLDSRRSTYGPQR